MTFAQYQLQYHNYKCITTFWDDFAIADRFGIKAIKDTFKRAMAEWGKNYKYLTELVIVLNHRCWMHYEKGRQALSQLYADLYHEANNYAADTLQGEEYKYYFNIID